MATKRDNIPLIVRECYHDYELCAAVPAGEKENDDDDVAVLVAGIVSGSSSEATSSAGDGTTNNNSRKRDNSTGKTRKSANEQNRKATCNICKLVRYAHSSTTSNFRRHTRTHPEEWKRFEDIESGRVIPAGQMTLDFLTPKLAHSNHQQKAYVKSVVLNLIVDCDLPMHIVERKGFIKHHETINSRLNTINRRSIQTVIDESCTDIEADLTAKLVECDDVSLTLDIWSDKQMRGYLGITVHFMHHGSLNSRLLSVERFSGSHTGDRIHEHYSDRVSKFNLERKVAYIVTDNASNMRKAFAVSLVEEAEEVEEEEWQDVNPEDVSFLPPNRISCFTHSLQLVVKDGLADKKHFSQAIARCSRLCTILHSSQSYKEAFEEKFGSQGIPADVSTRWNSTLRQVSSILRKGCAALNEISRKEKRLECVFSTKEWTQLEELETLLTPYAVATDLLQADKVVTISMVVPEVLALYKHTVGQVSKLKMLYPTARVLRDSLMKRFQDIFARVNMAHADNISKAPFGDKVYFLATILDPNYQLLWVEEEVEFLDIDTEESQQQLCTVLKGLVCDTADEWYPDDTPAPVPVAVPAEEPPAKVARSRYLAKIRSREEQQQLDLSLPAQFRRYLCSNHQVISDDGIDCLQFWARAAGMPTLSKLAMRVMTVPASSASVERVFSHGSLAFTPHRARMSDKNLTKIIMLKCNRLS